MLLFDDFERTDDSRGRYAEDTFSLLNRSARPEVAGVRDWMERWFSRYPQSHQPELRARFRRSVRRGYEAPFFELFVHELLFRLGATPTVHPEVQGTHRRPDFMAKCIGEPCVVEAAVVMDESSQEGAARAREELVYDLLNQLESPDFFIDMQVNRRSTTSPSGQRMRNFLQARLNGLDPDRHVSTVWEYEESGWSIAFTAIPKKEGARGKPGVRPLGVLPIRSAWLDTRGAVCKEVRGKSTRYGQLGLPFVVALNVTSDWGCDDEDVVDALFGTRSEVFRTGEKGIEYAGGKRNNDGAWRGPAGPINTRNSGVLLVKNVQPWSNSADLMVYVNPHAEHRIPTLFEHLPHATADQGRLIFRPGIGNADFLSEMFN